MWYAGGEDKCVRGFSREPVDLEDLDTDGKRITFQWILLQSGCRGVGWNNLAQERHKWRAVVNTVMNLRVTYNAGNFLPT
jgi:hypothetical protein